MREKDERTRTHDEMNTDHTREPVGDEFINRKWLYTSKRLPTTHTAYSITNRSDGSIVCHIYTLSKSNAVDLL